MGNESSISHATAHASKRLDVTGGIHPTFNHHGFIRANYEDTRNNFSIDDGIIRYHDGNLKSFIADDKLQQYGPVSSISETHHGVTRNCSRGLPLYKMNSSQILFMRIEIFHGRARLMVTIIVEDVFQLPRLGIGRQ